MTRPDIAPACSIFGQFSANPGRRHWKGLQLILRYLSGTIHHGIIYRRGHPAGDQLTGAVDANWANTEDGSFRSRGGYVFLLAGGAVSWSTRAQLSTALSSCESEIMAASDACRTLVWLRRLLHEFRCPQPHATSLLEDNRGCISFNADHKCEKRTRHIGVRYMYAREVIQKGEATLTYCRTDLNYADHFTKALGSRKFLAFRPMYGVVSFDRGVSSNSPLVSLSN